MINGTMMQYFHWYVPEGKLWKQVKNEAPRLAALGITSVWLPPAFKGMSGLESRGYDLYDLYDLGEFNQKETVATRYGTKEEYLDCLKALKEHNIQVYVDVVLNHMGGADEMERITVRKVDDENRNHFISDRFEIDAYTKFTFPGRKNKYSQFVWDHHCFTGVDYAADLKETAIFSIQNEYGSGWEEVISNEKGNFDYLMCTDIEYRNEAVREEIKRWGKWYLETTGFDGVRLDAVKHIAPEVMSEWLDYMRSLKPDLFAVGEYWAPGDLPLLHKFIDATGRRMALFDACLHHNLFQASQLGREYDLRKIFEDTLVAADPEMAVSVVDNHDTQPLQMLEAPVEPWFKPIAYSLTLLREQGYPCVFYPDLYGACYNDKGHDGNDCEVVLPVIEDLEKLLTARKNFAFGPQRDYFEQANCIGWVREGLEGKPGCAVLISTGDENQLYMEMGSQYAGKTFIDLLGHRNDEIQLNEKGGGNLSVNGGSVSVWVEKGRG